MDPRLQQAAEYGSINDFYALIDENPYILDNINVVPFVNTPLHVAASFGNIPFALEMMNLMPSFARKLNTSGYSPLHLAVEKEQTEFVSWLIYFDPSLSRIKGKEGITPFHLMVSRGNVDHVVECLITSPECIQDVNVNGHNALHLAVVNDRFEVNGDGLTFLDIIRTKGQSASGDDLAQVALKTGCKDAASLPESKKTSDFFKSPITFCNHYSTSMRRLRSDTSEEGRAVFLIICALIITTTYQTALQPPGGVHQSEGDSKNENAGSVVMDYKFFIPLWISNTVGFCCALFYTYCLLPPRSIFTSWFLWIGISLCFSYALAMAVISPFPLLFLIGAFFLYMYFPICLAGQVLLGHWQSHLERAATQHRLSWFWKA